MKQIKFFALMDKILFFVAIFSLLAFFVYHEKTYSSTRPWDEEDGQIIFIQDQWDKLIEFTEDDCPVEFTFEDNSKRRIHSMGLDCLPIHKEPNYSVWPAGCFYWIHKLNSGLEHLFYSHSCPIHFYTPAFGDSI